MSELPVKSSLSASRRQLLELMQRYNFCRIENLEVRGGEPLFDPALRVIHEIKLGAKNERQPESEKNDFLLRNSIIDLFEHLEQVGNGRIAVIEVRHGLPFRLLVERPAGGDA